MTQPPPPPLPPAPAPSKKGMPAVAWVGIGCGTLLIIAVVAVSLLVGFCKRTLDELQKNPEKTTAELIIRAHPDLELVRSDEEAGTLTIRHRDQGEVTLSYRDIKEGRFSITDSQGNTTEIGASDLSKVPGWVPRAPGVSGDVNAVHHETDGRISGFYTVSSSEPADAIEEHFKAEASHLGLTHSKRSVLNANGTETRSLTFSNDEREISLVLTATPGNPVSIHIGYQTKK